MNIFSNNSNLHKICLLFLVVFVGIFFKSVFLEKKIPAPMDTLVGLYHPWRDLYAAEYPRGIPFKNFLITDPVRQQIPWRKIAIDDLKQGKLPLWNPYSFAGYPLLGNIQSGVLYPLNSLFFLFAFPTAWSLVIILQPLLGGVFLYWYLFSKKINPVICLISAISWSFSGFSIAWLTWGTIVHTAIWLPVFLLAADKIMEKNSRRMLWSILLGLSITFSFFAGHVQIFFYILLCLFLYVVSKLMLHRKNDSSTYGYFLLSLGIFVVLSLFQLKELYQLVILSSRTLEENLMTKEGWFLPWQHLIQFLMPDFFGNPATLNYWGTWNYGELVGYIGILPLFFAWIGIMVSKSSEKKFWTGLLIIALLFILPTPVAKLPFIFHIPFISSLQPTRLIVLVVYSLIMLSALGLQEITMGDRKDKKRIYFSTIAFLLVYGVVMGIAFFFARTSTSLELKDHFGIAFRNSIYPFIILFSGVSVVLLSRKKLFKNIVVFIILLLVSVDLFRFGRKFTPFTDSSYFFPTTKIINYLQSAPKPSRVLATDDRLLPPNVSAYYGIETISGYDPLYSKYFEGLIAAHNRNKADLTKPFGFNRIIIPTNQSTPIFDLFNIVYILSYGPLENNNLQFVMNEGETYLYQIINPLERIYFVDHVYPVDTYDQAISKLFSDISVRDSAVVQGDITGLSDSINNNDVITLERYENSFITFKTDSATTRYLTILNSYFPGWKANIDDRPTKLFLTDGAFMGLVVPEGHHTIQLRYE